MALNMTKGLIPLPPIEDRIVDVSQRCEGDGRGFDFLGERTIRGVVLHRSQGIWEGNHSHFHSHCPGALTDLQVHHEDGRMMRFVRLAAPGDSINAPAGWANGRLSGAYGDGKAFVAKYGELMLPDFDTASIINRDQESVEITGFFEQPGETTREDPVSDACWETLAQWIASRAHDYGIPFDEFPDAPQDGFSFVRWHQEFTIGTEKVCPGRTVMNGTPALIERAREIMRRAQTSGGGNGTPNIDPIVTTPDGFVRFAHARLFHAQPGAVARERPRRNAPKVRELAPGEELTCAGFRHSEEVDGDDRWLRTRGPDRMWIHAGGVAESI